MRFVPVDTVPLFPALRAELLAVLRDLRAEEWLNATVCPGWSVQDVAAHLLGVELGNVASRRDGWKTGPPSDTDPDTWLNAFNNEWALASRRLSPPVIMELLDLAGTWFESYLADLDLASTGAPVGWASGDEPAPVWLDVAREYTERWVHQQQIRESTGRKLLLEARFAAPVIATFVHGLVPALASADEPDGTVVEFAVDGAGGGVWRLQRTPSGWEFRESPAARVACRVGTTVDGAWRMFTSNPDTPRIRIEGDLELGRAMSRGRAILGLG